MSRQLQPGQTHADGFMLMRYEGPGGRREWVWNSRDAITPFCILSADGQAEMRHGNWHLDRYEPHYVPAIGSRIFVDLTPELARPTAERYVERYWDNAELPMREHPVFAPLGKAGAVEHFIEKWCAEWDGHGPAIVTVDEARHAEFARRASEAGQRR